MRSKVRTKHSEWKMGLLIFALALAVRLLFLTDISGSPTFTTPVVDSMEYDRMARNVLAGSGLDLRFFWQPLFYPLFLCSVYAFSGGSIVAALIVQAIVGAATCVLVWRIGMRLFGQTAGWIAAIILMVNPVLLFFESQLLATGWATFWSAALILAMLRAAERSTWTRVIIVGFVGALSILTRPVFVPFLVVASIWLIVQWVRNKIPWVQILHRTLLGLVSFAMVLIPVVLLSYRTLGTVRILPYSRGINLYIGNNPAYRDTISIRPGRGWDTLTKEPIRAGFYGPLEGERYFMEKTKTYAKKHPALLAKGLAQKTLAFFCSRELPRNVDIYMYRKWSNWLTITLWKRDGFGFPFGILLPLAGVGWWLNRRKLPGVITGFVFLYPAAVILVFVSSRYRAPFLPVIVILTAGAIVKLSELKRQKAIKSLLIAASIFCGLLIVSWQSGPFAAENYDYLPELYYCHADSLDRCGQFDQAGISYQKAIQLKPDYVEAYRNLGLLLLKQGRPNLAIEQFRAGLENGRNDPDLHIDWGRVLLTKNDMTGAIQQFEKALKLDPNSAKAHTAIAESDHRLGKHDQAARHARRAVALDPSDPAGHIILGSILTDDQPREALEQFEAAARLPIDQPILLMNLANGFARLKAFDQAAAMYQQAIHQNPDNGLLYYNYGACLKEQGKLSRAHAMLDKAITLNARPDLAYSLLGEIYTQKKEIEHARACYQKVLIIDPGNAEAKEALKQLNTLELSK